MNIGMILDASFPPDPRVENEAVSLSNKGFNVFLFCLTYSKELKIASYKGVNIRRYTSNTLEYKLSALAYTVPFYTAIMANKIKHFVSQNAIDVLHIHDIRIAGAVFKVNKRFNLPTVLDLHDNLPEVMKLYPHLQKFPGKYIIAPKKWKRKEAEFIEKATKVVTVSPEFIETLKLRFKAHAHKFVLVPNTIRTSFYKDAQIEQDILNRFKANFVLLYLGDTHIRRGLETAIEAVNILKNTIKNIKLVIVGKNTTDPILKAKVAALQLEDYVVFMGWQNVSLFPSFIMASTICISPLHRNLQHDIAYANKLFQYMSFAKPLLVSNATAQKKLVSKVNSGLIHQEKNAEDFAKQTLLLYKDKTMRNTLGANGKQFIENEFVWEKASKKLIDLYTNLEA